MYRVHFLIGGELSRIMGGQPWGQPLTYDFSVIREKGVTTSSD
jgi:hypothetical protein